MEPVPPVVILISIAEGPLQFSAEPDATLRTLPVPVIVNVTAPAAVKFTIEAPDTNS
jgi:hypothetical protein